MLYNNITLTSDISLWTAKTFFNSVNKPLKIFAYFIVRLNFFSFQISSKLLNYEKKTKKIVMSSLADQLKSIRSNNETILDKKKRTKIHSVSLLYEPQVAAQQDFDTIYTVSFDALKELELIDPRFAVFENNLFSESSLSIDRLVQVGFQEN